MTRKGDKERFKSRNLTRFVDWLYTHKNDYTLIESNLEFEVLVRLASLSIGELNKSTDFYSLKELVAEFDGLIEQKLLRKTIKQLIYKNLINCVKDGERTSYQLNFSLPKFPSVVVERMETDHGIL